MRRREPIAGNAVDRWKRLATVQDYLRFFALKPPYEMSDLKQVYHELGNQISSG